MSKHTGDDSALDLAAGSASVFNWRFARHLNSKRMITAYRDDARGVQWERWCTRYGHPDMPHYGPEKHSYFIDGDRREFKSEESLLAALAEKQNVPDEPSAAREKGLSMKTGQTIENEATAQPLRSGGLVRPYRGRRCPECYWALYDGDWCQNSACRSHRQSPGRDALRLSNEEAAILIAIDPHRQNTPVCHGEKQSHE